MGTDLSGTAPNALGTDQPLLVRVGVWAVLVLWAGAVDGRKKGNTWYGVLGLWFGIVL